MSAVPTTPKGLRTREHILIAARRVFARAGFVTLRMGDVAEEAGVSNGALYRYFQNKDNLFDHLIGDIHEELYAASRAREHSFAEDPYAALLEANRGYLSHYQANRDVMRAFIEAMTVDARFRDIWWRMRNRHLERFLATLEATHGCARYADERETRLVIESLVSMVEQCAYTWFAQEDLNDAPVCVDTAARIVTRTWYQAFF